MKRRDRKTSCVTVVRVDGDGNASVSLRPFSDIERQRNMTPIYRPIFCTSSPACGHCWYCLYWRAAAGGIDPRPKVGQK